MNRQRPRLTNQLTAEEFQAWYWLKRELVDFCRREGLPTVGVKTEYTTRVVAHLAGQPAPPVLPTVPRRGVLPAALTPQTCVAAGWRCTRELRDFFVQHCGPGFRFNAAMRQFVHTQVGRPLADGIEIYRRSLEERSEMGAQLEYNRHVREYFLHNPGATAPEMRAAWWLKRAARRQA